MTGIIIEPATATAESMAASDTSKALCCERGINGKTDDPLFAILRVYLPIAGFPPVVGNSHACTRCAASCNA
jgi:hypothetical protein